MPIKSKEDRAAYDRAYRAKNAERKAAYDAQWRLDNAEHLKRRAAKRRLEKRAMCLIAAARVRCRNKGIHFELDGFAEELQRRIDTGRCELSGAAFDLSPGRKATSPSLDRRNPDKGYTPENVLLSCSANPVSMRPADRFLIRKAVCSISYLGRILSFHGWRLRINFGGDNPPPWQPKTSLTSPLTTPAWQKSTAG